MKNMQKESFLKTKLENYSAYNMAKLVFNRVEKKYSLKRLESIDTKDEMINLLISMQPTRLDILRSFIIILKEWFSYIKNNNLLEIINSLTMDDKKIIVKKAKGTTRVSYITQEEFQNIIDSINNSGISNCLYYITFLRCIYEGIYSKKLDVLKNLRRSDICGNSVTVHNDEGEIYNIEVSEQLVHNLIELSYVSTWTRANKFRKYTVNIKGEYLDSCFKFYYDYGEKMPDCYKSFWAKFKMLRTEFGINITPFQLFVSGIVNRLQNIFSDLSVEEIFDNQENKENKIILNNYIKKELDRCNYKCPLAVFKKNVII